MEKGLSTKEQEEVFWGDEAVLFLKSGGGHTTMHVCPNSQNRTLKRMNFTVCKIHLNTPDQKQVYKS